MIQVNELRVGNIVQKLIDDQWSVSKIGAREFLAISEHPEWVNPIPLTETWLLKLGFEVRDFHFFFHPKWGTVFLRTAFLNSPRFHVKTGEGSKLTCLLYVHQLQNLYFALTGEELTILP